MRLADRLHDMSGHYSVFLSQTADDAEKTAYQAYEDAVLLPDSQDAKDFWVGLTEIISKEELIEKINEINFIHSCNK